MFGLSDSIMYWSNDVLDSGSIVRVSLLELQGYQLFGPVCRTWTLSYIDWPLIKA